MTRHVHVIVEGETGSGKSRIAFEIETALKAVGARVVWANRADQAAAHAEAEAEAGGGWQPELPAVVLFERNLPRTE